VRASDHSRGATSCRVQPLSLQLNATSGHAGPYQATLQECLLGSRSRVRVAVGAHTLGPRSGSVLPRIGHMVMMPSGVAVPAACPMASPRNGLAAPLPACSVRPRWLLSLVAAVQVHRRGPGRGVPIRSISGHRDRLPSPAAERELVGDHFH
jgi:hypothetical protein